MFHHQYSSGSFTLRINCEDKGERRVPGGKQARVRFDLGATLYVGQAGAVHGGAFEGVFQELRLISGRPSDDDCLANQAESAPPSVLPPPDVRHPYLGNHYAEDASQPALPVIKRVEERA